MEERKTGEFQPRYTRGEEIFNMTSHIVGGVLGIVALVLCVIFSAVHRDAYAVVSSAIYGVTMILLYTMSSIYHGLSPRLPAKRVLQVIDHCSIYLLIAGSYTPFCLCTLRRYSTARGWWIFGIIWGLAVLGITLTAVDMHRFERFSFICYLGMGWCIIGSVRLLPQLLGMGGFFLLLTGGLAYTIGAVFYAVGHKKPYAHSIFHLFVVLGSLLHFLCILLYVV
jgi:hemolysin III